MCELMVARTNALVRTGGIRQRIVRGQTVLCAEDPVVKSGPRRFMPLQVEHHCKEGRKSQERHKPPVEQATAVPGDVREAPALTCDHPGCDVTARSAAGLAAHRRSHTPVDS